ncbi:tRNA (N6-isopentenyl adenosine(37)-C2)-methylthiotransferase MiaB [Guggenheimella bovis]
MELPVKEQRPKDQAIEILKELTKKTPLTYSITTFGCQMNDRDSETMKGLLNECGFKESQEELADIMLYNTCAVRENAEQRFFGHIGNMKRLKSEKKELIVGACGCMVQQEHILKELKEKHSHVDLVFGTHNFYKLPSFLLRVLEDGERVLEIEPDGAIPEGLPMARAFSMKAFVNIMQGCNNFCSYCIVPYTRGREVSRPVENIVEEIEALVRDGVKEVTLLGQNVNSYKSTLDFAGLLRRINEIEGLKRIRFMTSHPKDFSVEVIKAMRDSDKVMPYVHLPLQSGSNRILKLMNRKYTREDYLEKVKTLKEMVPDVAISTDLIIGFPTETDEDVDQTIDMIRKVDYDSAFTFIYSKRVGTPAAVMEGQSTDEEKHERFDRALKVLNELVIEKNSKKEGNIYEVLIDRFNEESGCFEGRTPQNTLVQIVKGEAELGDVVEVKITKARKFSLEGEVLCRS